MLICAPSSRIERLRRRVEAEFEVDELVTTDNAIDAVGLFLSEQPTHVVIDGELDGRGGVRAAAALSGLRTVPTTLVVEPETAESVIFAVQERGLDHVKVRTWAGERAPELFASGPEDPPSECVARLLSEPFDAIVLLGSAGTPHMLPTLVPRLRRGGAPLVVAVHHNPRLSKSFAEWVGELAGTLPKPLHGAQPEFPALSVAKATPGVDTLQPDLDLVLRSVLQRRSKILVVVTSGMEFEGIDAVQLALDRGATLVALRPELCPQPAMVQRLVDAQLGPTLCTHDEIAQLIRLCTRAQGLRNAG